MFVPPSPSVSNTGMNLVSHYAYPIDSVCNTSGMSSIVSMPVSCILSVSNRCSHLAFN